MRFPRSLRVALACCLAFPVARPAAQDRPLPDPQSFLQEARKHLQRDQTLQSSYSYVETRRELSLDKQGRTTNESVKVLESYPGLPGEDRWERLISENGKAVPAEQLEKRDRERQKKAEQYAQRLASRPEQEHAKQVRDWEKAKRETDEVVDDIFRVYDFKMLGRESVSGHDVIAFSLTPRRDGRPQTRDGKMMRAFTGRVLVSESDYEIVRLDVEAIDSLSWGLGLLARLHKGARLSFERRKVNGEVWLPALVSYSGSARVGMIKTIRRGGTSEFSNYRKFTVDATSTYKAPS